MTSKKPRTEYSFRGVTMPTASHPTIRRVKRQVDHPSIHGDKLWRSSYLLIDYLTKHQPEHTAKVLDVGCGWGLSGIWCASALGSEVTSVDADPNVFPFLDAVAEINKVQIQTLCSRFEKLSKRQLAQYDMLIAGDICFWEELVKPVSNMVNRAVDAGVKHIIIADPERAPFFDMAQLCIDQHCADLLEWSTKTPVASRGSLMVIENA